MSLGKHFEETVKLKSLFVLKPVLHDWHSKQRERCSEKRSDENFDPEISFCAKEKIIMNIKL